MGVHLINETGELFKKIYRLYHIFIFVFFPFWIVNQEWIVEVVTLVMLIKWAYLQSHVWAIP